MYLSDKRGEIDVSKVFWKNYFLHFLHITNDEFRAIFAPSNDVWVPLDNNNSYLKHITDLANEFWFW